VTVVLDSWAVLAYLGDDGPAAQAVDDLLSNERPVMSWINLGEVFYIVRRRHGEQHAVTATRDLRRSVDCRLPDEEMVLQAGRFKADRPMAYADAFAAATAIAHDATLWTGDPELLTEDAAWRWLDLREDAVSLGRTPNPQPH
jgi:predicted nucleic acid-binding protein